MFHPGAALAAYQETARKQRIAQLFQYGFGFPGKQGFIDLAFPFHYHGVGADLLAG